MYPIPILTRDVPGYRIGIHPDTHWKGMTIQLYLPRDNSIQHVGTIFHKRTGDKPTPRHCKCHSRRTQAMHLQWIRTHIIRWTPLDRK
jgi:hypothetical protein